MPRNVSIRISQNDKQDYQRLVRNAKAKIRRVKKKYNRELSSSVELPSLSTFKSRKQLIYMKKLKMNPRLQSQKEQKRFSTKKKRLQLGVSFSIPIVQFFFSYLLSYFAFVLFTMFSISVWFTLTIRISCQ